MFANLSRLFGAKADEKGIELILDCSPSIPRILIGDALRLGQVLTNLAANALKFTEKGRIIIAAQLIADTPDTANLRFFVRDTGIGLNEEQTARLFQPFSQADSSTTRRFGGTGLGLAISKQLVEMMQGEIGVTSRLGHGSEFFFTARFERSTEMAATFVEGSQSANGFGRSLDSAAAPDAQGKPPSTPTLSEPLESVQLRGHVLLVDDNPMNQIVAHDMLIAAGLEVTIADNGRKAINLLSEGGFDLVLMDIQMPEMNGYEATRAIREQTAFSTLPILAMTAHAMSSVRDQCLAAGMNGHIAKPINLCSLHQTLAQWLPINETPTANAASAPSEADASIRLPDPGAGIDVRAALERLGHKRARYRRILLNFALEYRDKAREIDASLGAGELEKAGEMLHTVKGVAGNLGMLRLYDAIVVLENSIKAECVFPEEIGHFQLAFSDVMQALSQIGDDNESLAQPETGLDEGALPKTLSKLADHLRKGSPRAADTLPELKHALGGAYPAELEQLTGQIESFDFETAEESLEKLLAILRTMRGHEIGPIL